MTPGLNGSSILSLLLFLNNKFMQSWKFNSIAQGILREAISRSLKIPYTDVYKTVRDTRSNFIKTKDGKIYEVILKEV